jgi:hypothetical protein
MFTHAVACGVSLVTHGGRLRLIALPPKQDVAVGQICQVTVKVSATEAAEVSISFPENVVELISPSRIISVEAGMHEQSWTFLTRTSTADAVVIEVQARSGNLKQVAAIRMRVLTNEHS